MKIEILGSGCAKCNQLYQHVGEAVNKAGISAEVVKVEALEEIIGRGVMMTPSLFVDGEELVSGRVPSVNELVGLLKDKA